jgi:hypothetical protein
MYELYAMQCNALYFCNSSSSSSCNEDDDKMINYSKTKRNSSSTISKKLKRKLSTATSDNVEEHFERKQKTALTLSENESNDISQMKNDAL